MVDEHKNINITAIGLMSGTSLDGLDICLCRFVRNNNKWDYDIIVAETYNYSSEIKEKLATAQHMTALQFVNFHSAYGKYIGKTVRQFIEKYKATPSIVASHGHTIFHQPASGFTFQIGCGADIAIQCGVDTICDFRTSDIAAGGQGAPLVPVGDRLLFSDFNYCLNLGGFANISYEKEGNRIAYDICPVNYVLNHYTRSIGKEYDEDGGLAAEGNINNELLESLNNLDFYAHQGPKSLSREWVEDAVIPLIESYDISLNDKLRTFCEHVAMQIGHAVGYGDIFVTGGGAFNLFLLERIASYIKGIIKKPDMQLINYKEALIFAFLGVLYLTNQKNCLSSVTGSRSDCIGGALYKASVLSKFN
jgi:anhydro-N-acetylmuramic acid kinase